jgi:hypothetical protein
VSRSGASQVCISRLSFCEVYTTLFHSLAMHRTQSAGVKGVGRTRRQLGERLSRPPWTLKTDSMATAKKCMGPNLGFVQQGC